MKRPFSLVAFLLTASLGTSGCAADARPDAEATAVDGIEDGVDLNTFRPGAYTSPAGTVTRRAPFSGSNGTGPDRGANTSGLLSVSGEQAAGGYDRVAATVFNSFEAPAAESRVTVTSTVAVQSAFVRVVGALFGYAKGEITLTMRVVDPAGGERCRRDIVLAKTEGALGEHRSDASPGPTALTCAFDKDASRRETYRVEASLGTYREAAGGAWVQSAGRATVESISFGRNVEPGVIVGHLGYCVEPAGVAVVGTPTRLAECTGSLQQKWTRQTSGAVVHRASGLCLEAPAGSPDGTQPRLSRCLAMSPVPAAQFTVGTDGFVVHRATGKCLDAAWEAGIAGGYERTPIQLWSCIRPNVGNQLWTFHP